MSLLNEVTDRELYEAIRTKSVSVTIDRVPDYWLYQWRFDEILSEAYKRNLVGYR
jgi:hypothetical protein